MACFQLIMNVSNCSHVTLRGCDGEPLRSQTLVSASCLSIGLTVFPLEFISWIFTIELYGHNLSDQSLGFWSAVFKVITLTTVVSFVSAINSGKSAEFNRDSLAALTHLTEL